MKATLFFLSYALELHTAQQAVRGEHRASVTREREKLRPLFGDMPDG